jgi:molybdopterin-synthase adenylyltransferase
MHQSESNELDRYHRQMLVPGWGSKGQSRLKASSIFIAGAGGLGSSASIYLAAAGVGEIRICDSDSVTLSNLNRQIMHTDIRVGMPKAESAALTLQELNPTIKVIAYNEYLDRDNLHEIVGFTDIVVDCLDNFETRYLLNSYCIKESIPLVHGAVRGMTGQATFLHSPSTPCFRCIIPQGKEEETMPMVGATPGIIGCIQALEVLKYLTGIGENLKNRMLVFDGEMLAFDEFSIKRRPSCPDCGELDEE